MIPDDAPKARPTPPRPQQPAPLGSPRNLLIAGGLIGGLSLLCVLPVMGIGLAWIFSKKADPNIAANGPKQEAPEPEPPEIPVVIEKKKPRPPEMPAPIRLAVDKGVGHLKNRLLEKGGPYSIDLRYGNDASVGAIALAGLALLEAKVPHDDPAVQKALADVRRAGPTLRLVYALGAVLFFLNRLHDAAPLEASDRQLLRTLAMRMVAGQRPDGYWPYVNPPVTPAIEEKLLAQLRANTYRPGTLKRFGTAPTHSMTQFALLSLWGSRRHDLPMRSALLAATTRFQHTQYPDGSWGYATNNGPLKVLSDSNTCAGLIALAMEKSLREDDEFKHQTANDPPADPTADERREKAFARLTSVIGRTKDDPIRQTRHPIGTVFKADAWGDYYFLWCLERVAVIYDKKTIGGKDWYAWGSEVILQTQRGDGSWLDRHGDVPDTCFALLFLTRANLAKDLTESIRTRGGKVALP